MKKPLRSGVILQGKIDSIVSIDSIHEKLKKKARGMSAEILNVFRMLDDEMTGRVSLDDLVNIIRKFNFDLDEDELIALMQRCCSFYPPSTQNFCCFIQQLSTCDAGGTSTKMVQSDTKISWAPFLNEHHATMFPA